MRKSNKSVYLNLMIAGVLSHEPLSAWAQAPATTKDEETQKSSERAPASMSASKDDVLEEIIVRGVIYSILNSQRIKRDAASIVDAVTAEDLGKFTDQNVAEALARVPGVQIQRANGGEGTQISVRGLGPELEPVPDQWPDGLHWRYARLRLLHVARRARRIRNRHQDADRGYR